MEDDDNGIVFAESPNTPTLKGLNIQRNDDRSFFRNRSTICPRNLQKASDPGDQMTFISLSSLLFSHPTAHPFH